MQLYTAGKHAAEILAMSLDGFMESRRILTSLVYAAGESASKIGAAGMLKQTEDYQRLERLAAQNAIGIRVCHLLAARHRIPRTYWVILKNSAIERIN